MVLLRGKVRALGAACDKISLSQIQTIMFQIGRGVNRNLPP